MAVPRERTKVLSLRVRSTCRDFQFKHARDKSSIASKTIEAIATALRAALKGKVDVSGFGAIIDLRTSYAN